MQRKAVLIDPVFHTIAEIVLQPDDSASDPDAALYDMLKAVLGCSMIEVTPFELDHHPRGVLLSDEEGLYADPAFFTLHGHPIPGRALLMCDDGMGGLASSTFSPGELAPYVQFVSARFAQAASDLRNQEEMARLREQGFVVEDLGDGLGYMVLGRAPSPPASS